LEKIIQTIENWQKQKKLSQTLKPVSKCDKVFFPTKRKDAFLKKIAIFFFEKREYVKKNPLLFF
jgi:hypothetical protein